MFIFYFSCSNAHPLSSDSFGRRRVQLTMVRLGLEIKECCPSSSIWGDCGPPGVPGSSGDHFKSSVWYDYSTSACLGKHLYSV